MLRLVLVFLLAAIPATSEEVVAGLSQSRIAITTDFDGSEILIFGAVKRDESVEGAEPLGVIVTVEGPSSPLAVRKKDKRYGIWVNTDAREFDAAPSFYAVSTSAPWEQVIETTEDLKHSVSVQRAIHNEASAGTLEYIEALIRIRSNQDLFQTNIGAVTVNEETLFSTSVRLPANLTEGDYRARFFLTRGGKVVDSHETAIAVQKVGLERFLFRLAHDKPFIYGLMSLAIAIGAGWAASAFFRYFRF